MLKEPIKLILKSREHIIVKNYHHLQDITDSSIQIDDYLITGLFLKIMTLDEELIQIYGKIKEIKILD